MGLYAHRPDELTCSEAARALGVTRITVWTWVKAGKIDGRTARGPGGRARYFVKLAAVVALQARNRRAKRLARG